ncbi:MAG: hypothetical protein SGI90_06160 [Candidatus Eisenbacteria bacterium]|nr:hypothetical protein [Candidatus Eisenbacteria bacterium]
MSPHFQAFSFVDHIDSGQPGVDITGRYTVPAAVSEFSASLVAEAVGQLAAWSIMSAKSFARRPLAGIAGRIELLAGVRPGQILDLAAEIESLDDVAVVYRGAASADGIPVIRLYHCIGPMMASEQFDDPLALQERFELLSGSGTAVGGFSDLPYFLLEVRRHVHGQSLVADFQVPDEAPFFMDHFPRRPVFPGSLLMNQSLDLAELLAADIPAPALDEKWVATRVEDVKLRTFIPPGESLELEAQLTELEEYALTVVVETRRTGRITGSAQISLSSRRR